MRHLAGLAQSRLRPQAGSHPLWCQQMAGWCPPAPWHWDHIPSRPLKECWEGSHWSSAWVASAGLLQEL